LVQLRRLVDVQSAGAVFVGVGVWGAGYRVCVFSPDLIMPEARLVQTAVSIGEISKGIVSLSWES